MRYKNENFDNFISFSIYSVGVGNKMKGKSKKMTFGERLKTIRKAKGYKQYHLAQKAGIRQGVLSVYETDKSQPTVERLEWLCTALNVSATELLGF